MKKERNPKIRNKSGPGNNNQHRKTNTDPETIIAGRGCSLCVDLGHGIGLGYFACQAVQTPEETVDEQNQVDKRE